MNIGVLDLQGDVSRHRAALLSLACDPVLVRNARQLDDSDGLIIPGGESTALSLLLESSGLRSAVTERIGSGMPVFGTCAGMILLATSVLDGRDDQLPLGMIDITVRRNGYGRQLDSFETDLRIAALGEDPFRGVFIRAPVVVDAADGVEVLASLPGECPAGSTGAVLLRRGGILVSSFHPELTDDARIHSLFAGMVAGPVVTDRATAAVQESTCSKRGI